MADFIFTLDVLQFFKWREVLGAHALSSHLVKRQNPILRAVSLVSQNLCVESLNQFYIFLSRKYASFGHSACCRNHYRRLLHLKAKYDKSPQKILSIFTPRQHKFSLNVLIWSKYISIMETTRWYLSIDMCIVLVQWNLSKPILIRTKEKYRFRQVIGLDSHRLTFTALGKISYKKLKCLHPTHHKFYK